VAGTRMNGCLIAMTVHPSERVELPRVNALRATILIGVVVFSTAGVCQIRFELSTKGSPMGASKDVVIGHSAMNRHS